MKECNGPPKREIARAQHGPESQGPEGVECRVEDHADGHAAAAVVEQASSTDCAGPSAGTEAPAAARWDPTAAPAGATPPTPARGAAPPTGTGGPAAGAAGRSPTNPAPAKRPTATSVNAKVPSNMNQPGFGPSSGAGAPPETVSPGRTATSRNGSPAAAAYQRPATRQRASCRSSCSSSSLPPAR